MSKERGTAESDLCCDGQRFLTGIRGEGEAPPLSRHRRALLFLFLFLSLSLFIEMSRRICSTILSLVRFALSICFCTHIYMYIFATITCF